MPRRGSGELRQGVGDQAGFRRGLRQPRQRAEGTRGSQEALASYGKALAIKPDFAGALNNRGLVLMELGRIEEALASYDEALALRPDFAGALKIAASC